MLAFGCELDHGPFVEVSNFDALGIREALLDELLQTGTGFGQLVVAQLAMSDLEAAHRPSASFGIVRGGCAVFTFELG
jgi:hypothetical protein